MMVKLLYYNTHLEENPFVTIKFMNEEPNDLGLFMSMSDPHKVHLAQPPLNHLFDIPSHVTLSCSYAWPHT